MYSYGHELLATGRYVPFGMLVIYMALACTFGMCLWIEDVREHRLRRIYTRPWAAAGWVLLPIIAHLAGETSRAFGTLAGSVSLWCAYALLRWLSAGSLGRGDVTLAAALGAPLGFIGASGNSFTGFLYPLLIATLITFVLGGLASLWVLARGRSAKTRIPFGPFMIAGAALTLIAL
ncbi:MAG: prepilin peptidase [Rothia sp. (in: high G+C Gram-positive bacteria)]|uniref:prepilin peptidase n=1 Tax=Rothia sp. (in: high G+C Gram-positive bacteria) TaxID=1885016 RepID=UPI0026DEF597|nr:prepilin peptidase [Rothia sp. (in: high G+C Gram-positive bacteria)]MDO5750297.1 prepilin peptidase [Rothia sp. (in: high G+C Gram-positive bacteria)]